MKRKIAFSLLALTVLVSPNFIERVQSQENMMAMPMINMQAAKNKMMEPDTMVAAEKAMMSDKSMVPAMMAKEMVMSNMMHDDKTIEMMKKADMAVQADMPAMSGEGKPKMADPAMVLDSNELQLLFQELVARHLVSKKMSMAKKTPAEDRGKMMPMMNESMMMESRKEMMVGDGMTMMMAREGLIMSLMKDPEVMSMVEKQARKMQESSMATMIADEMLQTKGEMMMKDPMMAKGVVKDAMVRSTMQAGHTMMEKKP